MEGSDRRRSRLTWVALAVAMLCVACTSSRDRGAEAQPDPAAPVTGAPGSEAVVVEGSATAVALDATRLMVPAGAIPPGSTVRVADGSSLPVDRAEILGPVVELSAQADLGASATLEMGYDPAALPDGVLPMLYTFVDDTGGWVPQVSTVDTDRHVIVAETSHLSFWSWGTPYYLWGRVTGDRVAQPSCSGNRPTWATTFDNQTDQNASVFSCTETNGDLLRLKLRANRGIPILIEFSHPISIVGGGTESLTISKLIKDHSPNVVYIGAQDELIVDVAFPGENRLLTARRWGGAGARYLLYSASFFWDNVVATNVSSVALFSCVWESIQLLDNGSTDDSIDAILGTVTACVEGVLEGLFESGQITRAAFGRLQQAFAIWRFADEFTRAVDTSFFDADDANYVYFSILARGGPATPESGGTGSGVSAAGSSLETAQVPSMCGHPAGTLVGGSLPGIAEGMGHVELDLRHVASGDVTGDGIAETAVAASCSQGGVAWPQHIVVYGSGGELLGSADLGSLAGDGSAAVVYDIVAEAGRFRIRWAASRSDDTLAGPSLDVSAHATVTDQGVVVGDVTLIDEQRMLDELFDAASRSDVAAIAALYDPVYLEEAMDGRPPAPEALPVVLPDTAQDFSCFGELDPRWIADAGGARQCESTEPDSATVTLALSRASFGEWRIINIVVV